MKRKLKKERGKKLNHGDSVTEEDDRKRMRNELERNEIERKRKKEKTEEKK